MRWSSTLRYQLLVSLLRDSTFSVKQGADNRRSARSGSVTLTFRIGYPHLASVSSCWLSLKVHHSAPVSWCWKIECHLVASLEDTLLGFGWCLASVSWRYVKHNSDPILDSPGYSDHSKNLAEEFSFALRKFLDTQIHRSRFRHCRTKKNVISWALLDMTLCLLYERKWLQENIEKFVIFNQRRSPFITCEICELVFGVNIFDSDLGVQIDSVKKTNQAQLCGFLTRVSLLDFCP